MNDLQVKLGKDCFFEAAARLLQLMDLRHEARLLSQLFSSEEAQFSFSHPLAPCFFFNQIHCTSL